MSQRSLLFGVHPSLRGSSQHFVNNSDLVHSNRGKTRYSQSSQSNRYVKQQREAEQRRLQREQRQRVH